ncbi:MAG: glutaredoxin family protein [Chloroflexota bacterium]|jgi:glutaredoxin|nr:glutaredoxin family protein [Anaerolineae bacterium]HMM28300.1 glutaredoxin family protein [Aggregatilineaceae bacterium]
MAYEIVMYSRFSPCPYVRSAKRVLDRERIPYREIYIDEDPAAKQRVIEWTGFQSVPTIILAQPGEILPYEEPQPLAPGASPKGVDRGPMITEPGEVQLENWLRRHGLLGSGG